MSSDFLDLTSIWTDVQWVHAIGKTDYRVLYGRTLTTALWCHHCQYILTYRYLKAWMLTLLFRDHPEHQVMELGAKLRKFLLSIGYLLLHQGKDRCLNFLRKPTLLSHVIYYYSSIWKMFTLLITLLNAFQVLQSQAKPLLFMVHVLHPPGWNWIDSWNCHSPTSSLLQISIPTHWIL